MRKWLAVLSMVGLGAALVGLMGCEGGGGGDDGDVSVGAQAPHGSPLDAGSEVPGPETLKAFWGDTAPRMGIMCQANSFKVISGERTDAYCPEIVAEAGALSLTANGDGTLTATAKDFVSSRSGLVWKFAGYTVKSESNPIITENPYIIQAKDQYGTFRGYWNSYLPAG